MNVPVMHLTMFQIRKENEPWHEFSNNVVCATLSVMHRTMFQIRKENEPWHGITIKVVCATSKASDQPAHMPNLIRAFAGHLNIQRLLSY